jgi:hypothetical protein
MAVEVMRIEWEILYGGPPGPYSFLLPSVLPGSTG